MSTDHAETVRRIYERWSRGDFSTVEAYHPEIEFEMPDWPEGSSARGVEGMNRAWRAALGAWDDFRAEADELIEADQNVIVTVNRLRASGKGSGAPVEARTACVWTFAAGKVVRLALYWNVARALEVAGVRGGEQRRPPADG